MVSRQQLKKALESATQHAMHSEYGGKRRAECLNTRFPIPAVYGIKREADLIFLLFYSSYA